MRWYKDKGRIKFVRLKGVIKMYDIEINSYESDIIKEALINYRNTFDLDEYEEQTIEELLGRI